MTGGSPWLWFVAKSGERWLRVKGAAGQGEFVVRDKVVAVPPVPMAGRLLYVT